MRALIEPWAHFDGPLPDYDHPLRCVFDSGVQYAVELLAKRLGVENWEVCDGTEEYDGDLGGTLVNIVLEAMPTDEHGDPIFPQDLAAAIRQAQREALEEAAKVAEERHHTYAQPTDWDYGAQDACVSIAAAIRALITEDRDNG